MYWHNKYFYEIYTEIELYTYSYEQNIIIIKYLLRKIHVNISKYTEII